MFEVIEKQNSFFLKRYFENFLIELFFKKHKGSGLSQFIASRNSVGIPGRREI